MWNLNYSCDETDKELLKGKSGQVKPKKWQCDENDWEGSGKWNKIKREENSDPER